MTTIDAAFMALNFNSNNSASASGSTSSGTLDTTFSDTLNLAEMSLSSTAGGQASGFMAALNLTNSTGPANTAAIDNSMSQIFALLQEIVTDMENAQGATSQNTAPASTASGSSAAGGLSLGAMELAQEGGPLPTFLSKLGGEMNLSTTQDQSLWNIAAENINAPGTQQTAQTIDGELQQAGIPTTIPSSFV